ncbi:MULTISPECIES: DUF3566 domain-containing protein [Citricoccus]|uniref:DUF3566 domain-containing protein n=1 Tax=Citricoccus muralis TaxID=169134 RepID=A0ABY8H7D0_9MICC|nr:MULTISPECIES: DUF3566 domain-containing protein [Citricoccus]WBL19898.1 DUF3566 domain-containing protein [Citricoccus sp. NR2]WFP16558.1 DUF3566 domain-containing protein [Citricoccus muralis]
MSNTSGNSKPSQGQAPKRPSAARPGTQQGQKRPAGAQGNRPQGGQNRPNGQKPGSKPGQKGLVRPAPKAKVRKARLLVARVDPWSVLKMSFLLSVALGIVTVVAGVVLWMVLDLTGIFDDVNALLGQILGTEGGGQTIQELVTLGQVASMSTIIAVINVVVLTLLSMLAAVLYNISASLVGGVGVTLTDD